MTEIRWSEWAAPAGMEEQQAYLAEHGIDDPNDPAVVSYRQLLRTTTPVATRHEVLVTVVVSGGRVKARAGAGGDRKAVAIETLVSEVLMLRMRLEGVDRGLVRTACRAVADDPVLLGPESWASPRAHAMIALR